VSAALAALAGALAFLGAAGLARDLVPAGLRRLPRLSRAAGTLADVVGRVREQGRDPAAADRRRLLLGGGGAAFAAGLVLAGPLAGLALGAGAPFAVGRALRARRERYRQAVDQGGAAMASGIADALAGGHSMRGAVAEAAAGVPGPAGRELARVARELELGARTDHALESMRRRVRAHSVDTIVAAALLQRRAGGDLARLLRDCARSFEDQLRLDRDVRAATAQARFTALLVVVLPLGGAALAELASPGFLRGLASSLLTAWLVGLALILQLFAALLMRRLGRGKA
jgi:tight adherence protein B